MALRGVTGIVLTADSRPIEGGAVLMSKLHDVPFWKCDVRIVNRSEPCKLMSVYRGFFCIIIHMCIQIHYCI